MQSLSGPPPPPLEAQLISNAANLENANLTAMAILALLLWDWLICLDREIRHFWTTKWTLGTWLYFINRGVPTLAQVVHITTTVVSWSPEVQKQMCVPTFLTLDCLAAVSFCVVQIIMTLRTYALYDCNRFLLWSLLSLSVGNLVNQLYWNLEPSAHDVVNTLPGPYNGCLIVGLIVPHVWAKWVPMLVFEGLLLILTWYKFMFYMRVGTSSLVSKTLFRDGFLGFFAVIAATVFGIIITILKPQPLRTLSQVIAPIIPVLVASHMLLNLRNVMQLSDDDDISGGHGTLPSSWSSSRDEHRTISSTTSAVDPKRDAHSIIDPWISRPRSDSQKASTLLSRTESNRSFRPSPATLIAASSSQSSSKNGAVDADVASGPFPRRNSTRQPSPILLRPHMFATHSSSQSYGEPFSHEESNADFDNDYTGRAPRRDLEQYELTPISTDYLNGPHFPSFPPSSPASERAPDEATYTQRRVSVSHSIPYPSFPRSSFTPTSPTSATHLAFQDSFNPTPTPVARSPTTRSSSSHVRPTRRPPEPSPVREREDTDDEAGSVLDIA